MLDKIYTWIIKLLFLLILIMGVLSAICIILHLIRGIL